MDPKPNSSVNETENEDQHGATGAEMLDPEAKRPKTQQEPKRLFGRRAFPQLDLGINLVDDNLTVHSSSERDAKSDAEVLADEHLRALSVVKALMDGSTTTK